MRRGEAGHLGAAGLRGFIGVGWFRGDWVEGNDHFQGGADFGFAEQVKGAVEAGSSFADTDEAKAAAVEQFARVEADTVVDNGEANLLGGEAEGEVELGGLGVAEGVGDGFLGNAEEVELDVVGDGGGGSFLVEGGLEIGVSLGLFDDFLQGIGETLGFEGFGAKCADGAAGFGDAFTGQVAGPKDVGLGIFEFGEGGAVTLNHFACDAADSFELEGYAGKGLGEGVMDLAGEAVAFVDEGGGEGDVLALVSQAGEVDGKGGLVREGLDKFELFFS